MNPATALPLAITALLLGVTKTTHAQSIKLERLPTETLNITAPSERVTGTPGNMTFSNRDCRSYPVTESRSRIVNTAVQEWAYFGFGIQDQTLTTVSGESAPRERRRRPRMSSEEAARVADSIAGYWSATPDSGWILQRQNESWNSRGVTSRWRTPWSAAFISWVMCENGLGEPGHFERAIAHHTYIDQAILAREQGDPNTAFMAYDPGEMPVVPGDLLCRGSRPAYQSIAERRRHIGVGARTHCDIVVKMDEVADRIMVIGGNVRGSVTMKLLPAIAATNGLLKPAPYNRRRIFAHLKLNADPISDNALDLSPTIRAMNCGDIQPTTAMVAANLTVESSDTCKE
ncbi:MAG: DUF2272 domain-containing protein [Gammaproteobacteria bacterium]|jgi:hypothetical protein|nr:hypothetical protein [Gammaproteobacteria bacterium]MDP6095671.1 DUF2272 domain-containing protein [Gammaproteobacteria bacterium]HJO11353.1 DUF2272 domain-containing protein [Gammaproteobacteria bacterium]|tara:strand:+ start:897 stop:1931 length:1035 start_codon:yes stop_codon:yes gene_type:complete